MPTLPQHIPGTVTGPLNLGRSKQFCLLWRDTYFRWGPNTSKLYLGVLIFCIWTKGNYIFWGVHFFGDRMHKYNTPWMISCFLEICIIFFCISSFPESFLLRFNFECLLILRVCIEGKGWQWRDWQEAVTLSSQCSLENTATNFSWRCRVKSRTFHHQVW